MENSMLRYIGIIGNGIVGKACFHPFRHNSEAFIIDPAYTANTIKDLGGLNPPLVFIAINVPTLSDNSVDAGVIYNIFQQLTDIKYDGLVVLKTTLTPDIVDDLYVRFGSGLRYIYSPEFLRELHWEADADKPPMILLAGRQKDCEELQEMYKNHTRIPSWTTFHVTDYKSASLAKYAINTFLACKVVFMNQMHKLYTDMNPPSTQTWGGFTKILSSDTRFGATHLAVPGPDKLYGYGGACFPKDMRAIIGFDKNGRLSVIREAEIANTHIRLTGNNDLKGPV